MILETVKLSRRNGRELIVVEMAETLNIHQDKHSQILKFGELIKQSDRNGREWSVTEIAETLKIHQENPHCDTRFMRPSNNPAEMEES